MRLLTVTIRASPEKDKSGSQSIIESTKGGKRWGKDQSATEARRRAIPFLSPSMESEDLA
jgi:hypothetical protein